jgi:hypothetical protein
VLTRTDVVNGATADEMSLLQNVREEEFVLCIT